MYPCTKKTSAKDRHERHGCHPVEKEAYLSHSLHDDKHNDGMTVPKHPINSLSRRNPIDMGKSTTNDAHDGGDDEMQRISKGGVGGELRSDSRNNA